MVIVDCTNSNFPAQLTDSKQEKPAHDMSQSEKTLRKTSSMSSETEWNIRACSIAVENLNRFSTQKDYQKQLESAGYILRTQEIAESGPSTLRAGKHRSVSPGHSQSPPSSQVRSEMRHSLQRHYSGRRQIPNTAPWILQRLQEDSIDTSLAILSTWSHPKRLREITPAIIMEINDLSTNEALEAVQELQKPKTYV